MTRHVDLAPDLVPRLSRGKHRHPRKGACFMELASYLAGERWSDHPACTHPLLAAMARLINDHTTDGGRSDLAHLVPSVIGLTSDDLHVDVDIVLRAATTALPIAAVDRQRILAVSILAAERMRSDLDRLPPGTVTERSQHALAQVPAAQEWALGFTRQIRPTARGFQRHAAPNTVRHAVVGIAHACVPDPDAVLRDLLADTIADVEQWTRHEAPDATTFATPEWAAACQLTGTVTT
jgi:hypothetical protein